MNFQHDFRFTFPKSYFSQTLEKKEYTLGWILNQTEENGYIKLLAEVSSFLISIL